ncbi:MAG: MoaD/ThiS family protein [Pirellulales bacterium]|nr:MoaD/ThiS family protein [Pirellulales bacterium]
MQVRVKLFAIAAQRVGRDEISIDVDSPANVATLKEVLFHQFPKLASLASHLLVAVNAEYADDQTVIPPNSEVALIPPVSGG